MKSSSVAFPRWLAIIFTFLRLLPHFFSTRSNFYQLLSYDMVVYFQFAASSCSYMYAMNVSNVPLWTAWL